MTEHLNSCSIGKYLQDACHTIAYCGKPGLKLLADSDGDSSELLLLRSLLRLVNGNRLVNLGISKQQHLYLRTKNLI